MKKKWFYEIPDSEVSLYRADEVIVGYDRLNDVETTLDQVLFVFPCNLKESSQKD